MSPSNSCFIQVAVDAPLSEALTYKAARDLDIQIGDSVTVPLGKREVNGVVVHLFDEPVSEAKFTIKEIVQKHSERPRLSSLFVNWLQWMANYYIYSPGLVFQSCFPPLPKATNARQKTRKSDVIPQVTPKELPEFTDEQNSCVDSIENQKGFKVHFLHGVTGSGKTEVYIRLLKEVLTKGQRGLVLVPEIALTPQLVNRFASHFPDQIALIHSHLTSREKTNQWWNVIEGQKPILIGTRSALFCPMENLGLIVIDEEHDSSFKQDEKLKYNARDMAVFLAQQYNIPIVMGSATPSLESWQNILDGKYELHSMKSRVQNRTLPDIELISLQDQKNKELPFWMSPSLYKAIKENLENKEQTALFLNRRGVAHTLLCTDCGQARECPNCAISLTQHGTSHALCHYCQYSEEVSEVCSECSSENVIPVGLGTEKIESDLGSLFPEANLGRADRDEIQSRESLEDLLQKVEQQEIDILIGTQMIAKGLDFPQLTLVGLVLADVGLNLPSFRSSERSFQLLTQVSGRAGRHKKGRVIIQTYNPKHPSITESINRNLEGFYEQELGFRKELNYPPFCKLASIKWQGSDLSRVQQTGENFRQRADVLKSKYKEYEDLKILGPGPSPLSKLKNNYRFHMLIKGNKAQSINQFCQQLIANKNSIPRGVRVSIDIDPMSTL